MKSRGITSSIEGQTGFRTKTKEFPIQYSYTRTPFSGGSGSCQKKYLLASDSGRFYHHCEFFIILYVFICLCTSLDIRTFQNLSCGSTRTTLQLHYRCRSRRLHSCLFLFLFLLICCCRWQFRGFLRQSWG